MVTRAYRNRRSAQEVLIAILNSSKSPIKPTPLMEKANVAWRPLMKYVGFLIDAEFLEKLPPPTRRSGRPRDKKVHYLLKTTAEGLRLLEQWSNPLIAKLMSYSNKERG